MEIDLHPDELKVNGPLKDRGFTLSLGIGEYEAPIVGRLLMVPIENIEKIIVVIKEIKN